MSRERDDVDPDVSELERALRALVPRSSHANHDRLLFAAGRESERDRARQARRLWMCAAGMPTVAAIVLALLLIEARGRVARLELALSDSAPPTVDANTVTEANRTTNPESTLPRPTDFVASTENTPTAVSDLIPVAAGTTAPAHEYGAVAHGESSSGGRPRYLELRNRVLRLGVEALADCSRDTSGASTAAAPLTNRALRQIYLPSPGRPPAG